jgi:hypothetical protein
MSEPVPTAHDDCIVLRGVVVERLPLPPVQPCLSTTLSPRYSHLARERPTLSVRFGQELQVVLTGNSVAHT